MLRRGVDGIGPQPEAVVAVTPSGSVRVTTHREVGPVGRRPPQHLQRADGVELVDPSNHTMSMVVVIPSRVAQRISPFAPHSVRQHCRERLRIPQGAGKSIRS